MLQSSVQKLEQLLEWMEELSKDKVLTPVQPLTHSIILVTFDLNEDSPKWQ